MPKRILSILVYFSFILLAVSCQAKHSELSDKPLEISLNMTAKELYGNNSSFKDFQKLTKGPIGRDQKGFDFPTGSQVTAQFNYPNGQLILNNVSFVNVMDDTRVKEYRLALNLLVLINHRAPCFKSSLRALQTQCI